MQLFHHLVAHFGVLAKFDIGHIVRCQGLAINKRMYSDTVLHVASYRNGHTEQLVAQDARDICIVRILQGFRNK